MNVAENTIRIYIFYYQPYTTLKPINSYVPVWAGKNGKCNVQGFVGDDTGDHISGKNKYYSELSGIYWVWKNTRSEVVGTCHYRRFFTQKKEPLGQRAKRLLYFPAGLWKKRFGLIYTQNINYWQKHILQKHEIISILKTHDAIFPVRRILRQSIKNHYQKYHNNRDLELISDILSEYYPEYISTFQQVLQGKRLFANNMFVMKKAMFNELMNWLFTILFSFEKRCELNKYSGYQERIFGFLSERLITLWVIHNKINYKELPLIYFKSQKPKKNA